MKIFKPKYVVIFLAVFNCGFCAPVDHCLAFVHIGNEMPSHVYSAVQQARFMNEDCPIYLLVEASVFRSLKMSDGLFLLNNRVSLVNISTLPLSEEHRAFKINNKLNNVWREGFWNHATERFFYLYDFMQEYNTENLIHLENDVLLYVDLNKILPSLKKIEAEIAAPFEWKLRCIPSFVFVKNITAFKRLIDHIVSEISSYKGNDPDVEVNDMCTLSSFGIKFGTQFMTPLPIIMPEYGQLHERSVVPFRDGETTLDFISQNYEFFEGYIFDAAALGVFIGGYDPRNVAISEPGIVHPKSLFDPSKFHFFWDMDEEGRKIPCFGFNSKKYKIINLHFHSKRLDGYVSYGNEQGDFPGRK